MDDTNLESLVAEKLRLQTQNTVKDVKAKLLIKKRTPANVTRSKQHLEITSQMTDTGFATSSVY